MSKITVTKDKIDRLMANAEIMVMNVYEKCTIVAVQLENGFILTESSSCVDPANYDEELGTRICLDHIRDQLWKLEGYDLQKKVHQLTE